MGPTLREPATRTPHGSFKSTSWRWPSVLEGDLTRPRHAHRPRHRTVEGMKLFATLLGALALLAGLAGGLRAYSLAADAGTAPVRPVAGPHFPQAQKVRPGIVFRWAPCRPPAHREGKACVTHVTRTVTFPAPAPVATAPVPASVPANVPVVHTSVPQVAPATHEASSPHEPGDDNGGSDRPAGGEHEADD